MNDASFRRILRSALLLSMTSSGIVAACGGAIETVGGEGPSSGAPSPTTTTTTLVPPPPTTEQPPPPPPPKKDSGVIKDAAKDAVADAGCGKIIQQDICTATISDPCELPPDGGGWSQEECADVCPSNDGGPSQAFGCNVMKDQNGEVKLAGEAIIAL